MLSVNATLLPLVMPTELKSFAEVKVMSLPEPTSSVVAPATVTPAVCVNAPAVVTPNVPLIDDAFNAKVSMSLTNTFKPLVTPKEVKLFKPLKVMLFAAPAATVVAPVTVSAPF